MFSAVALVELARKRQGGVSDYRIAKLLDIHPNGVSGWRHQGKLPSNPVAKGLAELAGVDPVEAVLQVNLARATTPEEREVWEMALARLAPTNPQKKAA